MANAGISAVVGQEESFMVAFISFQTSLDAAFVKNLLVWVAVRGAGVPRRGCRYQERRAEAAVQKEAFFTPLVHVVSIEIVYCESLLATGLSKT